MKISKINIYINAEVKASIFKETIAVKLLQYYSIKFE